RGGGGSVAQVSLGVADAALGLASGSAQAVSPALLAEHGPVDDERHGPRDLEDLHPLAGDGALGAVRAAARLGEGDDLTDGVLGGGGVLHVVLLGDSLARASPLRCTSSVYQYRWEGKPSQPRRQRLTHPRPHA